MSFGFENNRRQVAQFDNWTNGQLAAQVSAMLPNFSENEGKTIVGMKAESNNFHFTMSELANNASIKARVAANQSHHTAEDCKAGSHWIVSVPTGKMVEENKITIEREASLSNSAKSTSAGIGFGPITLGYSSAKSESSAKAKISVIFYNKNAYTLTQTCACCGKTFGEQPINEVVQREDAKEGEEAANILARESHVEKK